MGVGGRRWARRSRSGTGGGRRRGGGGGGEAAAAAPITQVLASAGRVLEGTQAELVLQPLRLAFETKHVKLVEPALDCLHVTHLLLASTCLPGPMLM